jgi:ArsR family transcriptional regulator
MESKVLEQVAEELRTLGHPLRIKIIEFLRSGEKCVCEIIQFVGAEQSVVSKHMTILKKAGLVDCRKEGSRVIYWVRDPVVFEVCYLAQEFVSRRLAELMAMAQKYHAAR